MKDADIIRFSFEVKVYYLFCLVTATIKMVDLSSVYNGNNFSFDDYSPETDKYPAVTIGNWFDNTCPKKNTMEDLDAVILQYRKILAFFFEIHYRFTIRRNKYGLSRCKINDSFTVIYFA